MNKKLILASLLLMSLFGCVTSSYDGHAVKIKGFGIIKHNNSLSVGYINIEEVTYETGVVNPDDVQYVRPDLRCVGLR